MQSLLGLDIGTSGVKGILINLNGDIIVKRLENYGLSTPEVGWTEQDPDDWWEATKKVIQDIVQDASFDSSSIKGIGISGQMHSSVFLDENNSVIRPAILWSDTRTTKQCDFIYEKVGGIENLISYVSNSALEGFTAPKVLWLKDNEPENYSKVSKVIMPKDYIRYKLTGEIFTDISDAAGTLMFDVQNKTWSEELLSDIGINPDILPPVLESTDVAGKITKGISAETGLPEGIPVVAGGADQSCGAIGSGIIKPGRVMVSLGSSGVVLAQTDNPVADEKGRVHLFNYSKPDSWYKMGVMLSAGMSYSWVQESMFNGNYSFEKLNKMAESVQPGSEKLLFLPYLFGERTPYADANARGVFFGISGNHKEEHFVRSVMEGVTFGLRDSLELIKAKDFEIEEVRVIGGGIKSQVWQHILADTFGEEIKILNVEEGPAFGAAILAGVGTNLYDSFEEAESNIIKVVKSIEPDNSNHKLYNKQYEIYSSLYQSLKIDFRSLANI